MKRTEINGVLGLIIIMALSACSSKVTESSANAPVGVAPNSGPSRGLFQPTTGTPMVCVPGVYNRLTKMTEDHDCSVLITLADGTMTKDLSRTIRVKTADLGNYTVVASAQ